MDISSTSSVAAAVSQASQAKTGSAVELQMLKKTLDIQAQSAAQLIEAIPQPVGNVGRNVNTTA